MKHSLIALSLVAAFAAPAVAEEAAGPHTFTANVGVVSNYIFRGISQSQHRPAIQGGVDYAHASGLYAGLWASQVNWTDRPDWTYQKNNHVEVDVYGGYKGTIGDVGYDVGFIRYFYPGDFRATVGGAPNVTANTSEVYVGATWNIVSLKYNHVVSQNIFGWGGTGANNTSEGSGYIDLTVTYPVNETVNVIAHVGRQNIKNTVETGLPASYTDWKLGVTKDFGFGIVGVNYTDTNAKGAVGQAYRWDGKDVGKGVVSLSFLKNF